MSSEAVGEKFLNHQDKKERFNKVLARNDGDDESEAVLIENPDLLIDFVGVRWCFISCLLWWRIKSASLSPDGRHSAPFL